MVVILSHILCFISFFVYPMNHTSLLPRLLVGLWFVDLFVGIQGEEDFLTRHLFAAHRRHRFV